MLVNIFQKKILCDCGSCLI